MDDAYLEYAGKAWSRDFGDKQGQREMFCDFVMKLLAHLHELRTPAMIVFNGLELQAIAHLHIF